MSDEVKLGYPKVFVPPCYVQQPNVLSHWRYEARREAQQIYNHLWLGPIGVTRDEGFLINNNIRVLISLADMRCKQRSNGNFEYVEFNTGGNLAGSSRLVQFFTQINQIIDKAAEMGVGAIIFCDSGNDNSATAAAAYVMHHEQKSYIEAIQFVQSKRFSISLDDVSKHNLVTFSEILSASSSAQAMGDSGQNKRMLEEEDGDEEMGGQLEKRRMHGQ